MFRKGPTPVWGTKRSTCSDHSEIVLSWERGPSTESGKLEESNRGADQISELETATQRPEETRHSKSRHNRRGVFENEPCCGILNAIAPP